MSADFARTPSPQCSVVTLTSQRTGEGAQACTDAAGRKLLLASTQPGFLGIESVRGDDGFGITLSYWTDEASIAAWRDHAEHRQTREFGRVHWYEHFEVRIAKVERAYARRSDA